MEKVSGLKLNIHKLRKIIMAVLCLFIGICMVYVLFNLYNPSQNTLVALGSVCMDVICIIILIIIISSFAFGSYVTNRTTWLYAGLSAGTIWALFLDFLNWAFDGSLEFGRITYWFTLGSLCMGPILTCILCLYIYSYMEETHSLYRMRKSAALCAWLCIWSFFISFALAVTGTAFEFVDGHYKTGALYDAVTVIPIVVLVYLTAYVAFNIKTVGFHDVISVAGYVAFMIIGALIEAAYNIGTTYVAVAIADIFIFVMLQNEIIATEKRNVLEWMKKSNTDELTGFYNRHAYESDIRELENGVIEEDFVYVSIDVNSLKAVNDELGHYAGDELLIGAAECIKKCFSQYGKLYRIGGDEFIALIRADEEALEKIEKELEQCTESWRGDSVASLTLSCGYATRRESVGMSIRQMAVLADRKMYESKDEYYRRMGIERRRK